MRKRSIIASITTGVVLCATPNLHGEDRVENVVSTYFTPLNEFIGPYRRVAVRECNTGAVPVRQMYAGFTITAERSGFRVATNVELARAKAREDKLSWQRQALMAIEIGSWIWTGLNSAGLVKIKEPELRAIPPLVGGGIRFGTTVIKDEPEPLPEGRAPVVELGPGECKESTVFALEVKP